MIIITGASRGIGKYLLEQFIHQGKQVLGIAHTTRPEQHTEHYHQLDVRDEQAVADLVTTKSVQWNNIVLINAAGISYSAFAHKADLKNWRDVIDTNLTGLFDLTRSLLPLMRAQGYGRIINFSSVVAQQGVAGTSAYAASKAGLWGLAKALATENATKNITINNINLGYFDIGMIEQVPEQILSGIINTIPAKRLGQPEEILSTVNYIIGNGYLNGASIDINGGLF